MMILIMIMIPYCIEQVQLLCRVGEVSMGKLPRLDLGWWRFDRRRAIIIYFFTLDRGGDKLPHFLNVYQHSKILDYTHKGTCI